MSPLALALYVEAARYRPFAWGAHDCYTWAAEWVRQVCGIDLRAQYPHWSRPAEALQIIRAAGGLAPLVSRHLGAKALPALAARGDVVLVEVAGRESLGIVTGHAAAAPGVDGLVWVPRDQWRAAWHVCPA